jgi:PPK2 family polyphosphate:nucleotide phosphotransferase
MSLSKSCKRIPDEFVISPGKEARIGKRNPAETLGLDDGPDVAARHAANIKRLSELQSLLYADKRFAVLIILQGMDASGKDGALHHLLTGVNPQGVRVATFKKPTDTELRHDYLWRVHAECPERGLIGVFNRSHYEDVLIVRVHDMIDKETCSARYKQINHFERTLAENDTIILKFFLHVSKDEQRRRLEARVKDPKRNWKMELGDLAERKLWDKYQKAYEHALSECSTDEAPWYAIPADHKWFRNLAISQIVVDRLEKLDLRYPKATFDPKKIHVE